MTRLVSPGSTMAQLVLEKKRLQIRIGSRPAFVLKPTFPIFSSTRQWGLLLQKNRDQGVGLHRLKTYLWSFRPASEKWGIQMCICTKCLRRPVLSLVAACIFRPRRASNSLIRARSLL